MKLAIRKLFIAAVSFVLASSAFADDVETQFLEKLKTAYPGTQFDLVKKTPIPGLYEVKMGRNIAYTEDTGRYFIFGNIWDMKERRDLSESARAAANKIDWNSLPLKDAIKIVKGNGSRKFAIFSDPDCPFCKRLEGEMAKISDYTAYVFLMPLTGLHPNAATRAEAIWCAKDRAHAWHEYVLNGVDPGAGKCDNPINATVQLGSALGFNGTPSLVRGDGVTAAGAMPSERLDTWLSTVAVPAAENSSVSSKVNIK